MWQELQVQRWPEPTPQVRVSAGADLPLSPVCLQVQAQSQPQAPLGPQTPWPSSYPLICQNYFSKLYIWKKINRSDNFISTKKVLPLYLNPKRKNHYGYERILSGLIYNMFKTQRLKLKTFLLLGPTSKGFFGKVKKQIMYGQ